jgi:hypothetical protein
MVFKVRHFLAIAQAPLLNGLSRAPVVNTFRRMSKVDFCLSRRFDPPGTRK